MLDRGLEEFNADQIAAWSEPPDLTVSQWADQNRKLSTETSAEPGQWITARNEPSRGIMDAVSDPAVRVVVIMSCTQVGKTETLLNVIGYHIDQDPAPMLGVLPTLEIAEAFSKERLAPMLRDTPALQGKVKEARTRDSGNTLRSKSFPGGHIAFAGANSPASLSSRPRRILLFDEVDRFPRSAGTEGDPVSLGRRRAETFWNRKEILASSPTIKGFSRIEAEWDVSDQRRFFVPCPHCEHEQHLRWAQVRWPAGQPRKAAYFCEECGCEWTENQRRQGVRKGHWQATAEGNGETAGFHLNQIYSPWVTLGRMAREFLEAKRTPETLKTWINTALGETYEEDAEKVDGHQLSSRVEDWGTTAPNDVLVVTCGVDVQPDRFEVERIGWGVGEESWSLGFEVMYGDPTSEEHWKRLDEYLLTKTIRQDGAELPVHAACIDTGGHHTQETYKFVRPRFRRRIYGIKGMGGAGRLVWPKRASKNNKGKINLFLVGVDAAKDAIYSRLKIAERGPGFCHFPKGREQEWFEQLTAEVVQTKYVKGFPTRVYILPGGRRNEALDARVYGYAALQSLNVRWGRLRSAESIRSEPEESEPPERAALPQAQPKPEPPQTPAPKAGVLHSRTRTGRRLRRSNWMA